MHYSCVVLAACGALHWPLFAFCTYVNVWHGLLRRITARPLESCVQYSYSGQCVEGTIKSFHLFLDSHESRHVSSDARLGPVRLRDKGLELSLSPLLTKDSDFSTKESEVRRP